jgi:hypothetical protein
MMRKRPISTTQEPLLAHDERWIDTETAAVVEVSSEKKDFPIDSALLAGEAKSWRAAKPGLKLSADVRSAAKAQMHCPGFRRERHTTHARIRSAMVSGEFEVLESI